TGSADLSSISAQRVCVAADTSSGTTLSLFEEPLLNEELATPNAGLEEIIRAWAWQRSIQVQTEWTGPQIAGLPEAIQLGPDLDDPSLIDFVQQHASGVVEVGDQVEPSRLYAQLVCAFPQCTFAIVSESRTRIAALRGELEALDVPLKKPTA